MLDNFNINGKKILITGVTSGLGLNMTRAFIKQGAEIVGIGRNPAALSQMKRDLGDSFKPIQLDLAEIKELEMKLPDVLTDSFDGFIHSAGVIYRRPIKMFTSETFSEIFNVNVLSGGLIIKYLYKSKLLRDGCSAVFISSVAAEYSAIGNAMYMSSKGAVNSLVRGLALELAKSGIRVNCVEPALIKTKLTDGISQDEINCALLEYPLGRLGEPEDVVNAVQFLLSHASNWITGQRIRLDGGLTLK